MTNLDVFINLKGRNQFNRTAAAAKKSIDSFSRSSEKVSKSTSKTDKTLRRVADKTKGIDRSMKSITREREKANRENSKIAKALQKRDSNAQKAAAKREQSRAKEARQWDKILSAQRKSTQQQNKQATGMRRITLQEAKRTEQIRAQNRLMRARAQKALGGGRGGFLGDPDAPATNLMIAGGALRGVGQQLGRANRTVIGGSLSASGDFEEAMSNVAAKGGSNKLVEQTELARRLGRETRFSAVEAADGLTFLAQAGFDAEKRIAALPPIMQAATATGTDLATTADKLSNVMTGYGLSNDQAAFAADVLTSVSNNSNQTLEQLGDAFAKVGPLAKGLNIPLKDTAVTLGLLADAGFQGAEGGTALRMSLLRIAAPDKKAKKELKKLGVTEKFRSENINNPAAILRKMSEGLKGKTDDQKTASLKKVVGARAIAPVLGLMEQLSKGRFEEKMAIDEVGSALAGTEEKMKTLTATTERLTNAIGDIGITFGEALAPDIKKLSDQITADLLPGIQTWVANNEGMAKGLAGTSLALQGLSTVGGGVLNTAAGIHGIRGFFRQMKTSSMTVTASTVTIAGGGVAGGGVGGGAGPGGRGKGSKLGAIATVAAVVPFALAAVEHGNAERTGAKERLEDQTAFADEAGAGTVERVNRLRQERAMAAELTARSGVGNSIALQNSSARLEEAQQQLAQRRVEEVGDDPLALFNKALEVLKGDDGQRQTAEKFQEAMALFVNKGIAVDVKVDGPGSASVGGSPLVRGDSGGEAA